MEILLQATFENYNRHTYSILYLVYLLCYISMLHAESGLQRLIW